MPRSLLVAAVLIALAAGQARAQEPVVGAPDADALFQDVRTRTVAELAALAGSPETARLRLRLLLALDAMMLWNVP